MELALANDEFSLAVNALKRRVTAAGKEIKAIYDEGKLATSNPESSSLFFGMHRALEKYFCKFETSWEEIVDAYVAKGKEADFPKTAEHAFWNNVRGYYYQSNKMYEELKTLQSSTGTHSRFLDSNITMNESRVAKSLPRIPIPHFDGNILHFPKFRDTFTSLVHDDASLSPIDKFHYLISALQGPAASVIGNLAVDGTNYDLAWRAILDTYDNKRMLATSYLNQVLSFRPHQGKATIDSLQLFLTSISDAVSAFRLLKIENESEFVLFYIAIKCLDPGTREQFELTQKSEAFPTFESLTKFVRERCTAMQLASEIDLPSSKNSNNSLNSATTSRKEGTKSSKAKSLMANNNRSSPEKSKTQSKPKTHSEKEQSSSYPLCHVCKVEPHHLLSCERYERASVKQRQDMLKNWKGCRNCLSPFHSYPCPSKWHCRFCDKKHHSSLHEFSSTIPKPLNNSCVSDNSQNSSASSGAVFSAISSDEHQVILGTVLAEIRDARGVFQQVRMVLDSGSQFSFITAKCLSRLGLSMSKCPKRISGIGSTPFEGTKGKTSCVIKPRSLSAPNLSIVAMVVCNITSYLPNTVISRDVRFKYASYELADPSFWKPGPVDFLLGADGFADVFTGSTISFEDNYPKLLGPIFGHVVVGRLASPPSNPSLLSTVSLGAFAEPDDLGEQLTKFWEIEEVGSAPKTLSPDDARCEEIYKSTHIRLEDGSYMVRLPFKDDCPPTVDSSPIALRQFLNLEKKLEKNPEIYSQYQEFMSEYEELGHLSVAPSPSPCVIPHHSVVKETPKGPKLRVVFNASLKIGSISLNDLLLAGEKLQKDIRPILMNFRRRRIAFVSDLVKMFRKIKLHPLDRKYQHIYWRPLASEEIQELELNTVTYGLKPAPYLALRTLKQLVMDEGRDFNLAVVVVEEEMYVDDIATGAETIEEAIELANQIIGLMARGGFTLSKWASNSPELLKAVTNSVSLEPVDLSNLDGDCIKILGLKWDPKSDELGYSIQLPPIIKNTKRAILSAVARVYDPLGYVSPTIILFKMFIQNLWKAGYSWDQEISSSLRCQWEQLMNELPMLSEVHIPRFLETENDYEFQLVGFSDASSKAFCGAIYLRVIHKNGIKSFLLTSKTKLAPISSPTIPRLELCGAFLLARLYEAVRPFALNLKGIELPSVFFSDSSVVLGWLNTPSYHLKTFVANRVVEITTLTKTSAWRHVRTNDNPSDLGSRGVMPCQLVDNDFWWNGPTWLGKDEDHWPKSNISIPQELPETKSVPLVLVSRNTENPLITWMARFSSFDKLVRSAAWILRWLYNLKHVGCCCCTTKTGPLKLEEVRRAKMMCIRAVQGHYILDNFPDLRKVMEKYAHLSPLMDGVGIIRVGGRLKNASISADQKHPILLPTKCHFTSLLVDHMHKSYLHPGPLALQALIQLNFWIPSIRRLIRLRGFHCITCYKSRAITVNPKMGDLPAYRVNGGRPFLHVGIDFAGPFTIRESMRRKAPQSKVWLSLFVCMATKALHLEVVTRLSTDAFLAAFERFTSRRGIPSDVYSDCGSNFIGAARNFKELILWFKEFETRTSITNYSTRVGIQWHFNPPHTPHMGGIWEAGVKSVKQRLHLIVGEHPLTYEELTTVFTKIEAMLNSRPLCPLSNSPEEIDFLSPGHFLIGGPLLAIPEPSLLQLKENRLDRWQLVKQMTEHFWVRWRREYLWTLQHRPKWQQDVPNLRVGDLVLLKEDGAPPLQWTTARITETHPGKDGAVRVVTIKTSKGCYTRPVHKLVPLLPLKSSPHDPSP